MSEQFLIALTLEARRENRQGDLCAAIEERFNDSLRILNKGYGGNSFMVAMPPSLAPKLRAALPFATVERDFEIELLDP